MSGKMLCSYGKGGIHLLAKILGGDVPHGSQNPDPISDQNILFAKPLLDHLKWPLIALSNPITFRRITREINELVWWHNSLSKSYPISD